jgi:1,4-dihydroxy-2-naphthoate octaprenyltransferase
VSGHLTAERPSAVRIWVMAARPRTLPAAVAPVLVGTALAWTEGDVQGLHLHRGAAGRAVHPGRDEPVQRLLDARAAPTPRTGLGPGARDRGRLVPPKQVLVATYVAFGLAVLAGSYLIATAGWELLLVGAASILAGVLYTGGPRPYGYEGLARSSCSCSSASWR